MKKNKKIIYLIFFLLNILFILNTQAVQYNYPYVCDNESCYNTKLKGLNPNSAGYYIGDKEINKINNFYEYIKNSLNNKVNLYDDETIELLIKEDEDFVKKQINLEDIVNYSEEFIVGKEEDGEEEQCEMVEITSEEEQCSGGLLGIGRNCEMVEVTSEEEQCEMVEINYILEDKAYRDGLDYLFNNFSDVIYSLHYNSGLPISLLDDELNSLDNNILNYENKKIKLKNICDNEECLESSKIDIEYFSTNEIIKLNGNIYRNRDFNTNVFVISDDNEVINNIKAGEDLSFKLGFEDFLDVSVDETSYDFEIGYHHIQNNQRETFFTGSIIIDQDFNIKSPGLIGLDGTIGDIDGIITLEVLNRNNKHVKVMISQNPVMFDSGFLYFYLNLKNNNTSQEINNNTSQEIADDRATENRLIIPSDDLGTGSDLNISYELGQNINRNTTMRVDINLKDLYGNNHFDNISGYTIKPSIGSSEYIELAKIPTGGNDTEFLNEINGYKTTNNDSNISLLMRITEGGYHDFTGFDIIYNIKDSTTSYRSPIEEITYKLNPPDNFYDRGVLQSIFVNLPTNNDFAISCSKGPTTLSVNCLTDNLSGCNHSGSQEITFDSEGPEQGQLHIIDHAHNRTYFDYNFDHIDQSAPNIVVRKGSTNLNKDTTYYYLANDKNISITITENTTATCEEINSANFRYKIWYGGDLIKDGDGDGNKNINIENLFNEYGTNKSLRILATDQYLNSNIYTYTFNIYPNLVSLSNSSISTNKTNSKSANGDDYYTYTLTLKDNFGNLIYDKKIESIEHNCFQVNGCEVITRNMLDNTGDETIEIDFDNSIKTNENGKVTFTLKSIAPGIFSERFRVGIKDWDNKYDQNLNLRNYNIGSFENKNGFKSIFKGGLKASVDNGTSWNAKPILGTDMLYKLQIDKSSDNYNHLKISNNFKDYIIPYDSGNTTIELNESSISGLNTLNPKFEARAYNHSDIELGNPGIKLANYEGYSRLPVSYKINGKEIQTYISSEYTHNINNSTSIIQLAGEEGLDGFIGVKVIGGLQGGGNSELTGQDGNISDLSLGDIRASIRSNAYKFINSANEGQINNETIYFNGDKKLSEINTFSEINTSGVSTIVIKNGNLTIDSDIDSTIGIIVLSDGYDINKGQNQKGNIFINADVTDIDAILYSDGGVISTNNGNLYSSDSAQRTAHLQKQLRIKGSLFTRNTIGGAEGGRVLPGGSIATDAFTAITYDLNYLRRGNDGCDEETRYDDEPYQVCKIREATIIEYNPRVVSNPPKLFEN